MPALPCPHCGAPLTVSLVSPSGSTHLCSDCREPHVLITQHGEARLAPPTPAPTEDR